MPTYIVKNILCDFSCGMAIVVADTIEKAKLLFITQLNDHYLDDCDIKEIDQNIIIAEKDKVYYVVGGG